MIDKVFTYNPRIILWFPFKSLSVKKNPAKGCLTMADSLTNMNMEWGKVEKNGCSFWLRIAGSPVQAPREAFIYEPDWSATDWLLVVLGYMETFQPGEPVALILPMEGIGSGGLSLEGAQEAVLELASQSGLEQFP
ncbi:hypothetical protein JZU54_06810, partial [bacterium]|nr:hypothetical protein [bacterium]